MPTSVPQPNPFNSYDVTEKTTSLYLETEFAGSNWSGNAGVRVVRTKTTARYAQSVPVSLWTPTTVGSTQTWNVQYATSQSQTTNADYTLVLPSANLSYWLVPQQLQLRVAAAETMARPDLNQLAPNSTNNAENGQPELDYTGTVGLRPIKATQADLSLEWYYARHSALTAAVFEKRLRDDIYSGTQTSVNLGNALQYVPADRPAPCPGRRSCGRSSRRPTARRAYSPASS